MELSASMMCAKFDCLNEEVKLLDEAGIDSFHIDIMDGMFVPNLGMGLQDIECIRRNTSKPLEAHLMVCNTNAYLDIMKKSKVNVVYIHPEGNYHPFTTLQKIIEMGMEPGIVIDPGTSVETVRELLNVVKKVLVMAVNPGQAGQLYLPYIGEKIQQLIELKKRYDFKIYWDGACKKDKIEKFAPMGVDGFILGTGLLFGHNETYRELLDTARKIIF